MYKDDLFKDNYINEPSTTQKYFILRWGELLNNEEMHFRKLISPCLRMIIRETLEVVALYKRRVFFPSHIIHSIQELLDIISKYKKIYTPMLQDLTMIEKWIIKFQNEWKQIDAGDYDSKRFEKVKEIELLLQALKNKMDSMPIMDWYVKYFQESLNKTETRYRHVDEDIELLVSDLLYIGHSRNYLYRWGAGKFIYDQSKIEFLKRLSYLKELGNGNKRIFQCFFKLSLPTISDYSFLFNKMKNSQLIFYKDNEIAKAELEESCKIITEEAYSYFFEKVSIVSLEIQAIDKEAAVNRARELLESRVKLFHLDRRLKTYKEDIRKEVLVFDRSGNNFSVESVKEEARLKIEKTNKYLELMFSQEDEFSFEIKRLMEWIRVVQDSPKETAFIAMWSLLEFLFIHDFSMKRKGVIDFSVPIICNYYAKNTLNKVLQRLNNEKNKQSFVELEMQIQESLKNDDSRIKKHEYMLFFLNYTDNAVGIYKDKIVEQRYIQLVNQWIQERKINKDRFITIYEIIGHLEKQIRYDLSRIYRVRNMLAHEANVPMYFLNEAYEKMVFYCQTILDDILYSWFEQRKNSLNQVAVIKYKSYEEYKNEIETMHNDLKSKKITKEECCEKLIYVKNYLM